MSMNCLPKNRASIYNLLVPIAITIIPIHILPPNWNPSYQHRRTDLISLQYCKSF